jgi:hypothetical protein
VPKGPKSGRASLKTRKGRASLKTRKGRTSFKTRKGLVQGKFVGERVLLYIYIYKILQLKEIKKPIYVKLFGNKSKSRFMQKTIWQQIKK